MKTVLMTLITLVSLIVLASGPSTGVVKLFGEAKVVASSDIKACTEAKVLALSEAEESFVPSEWTYEFRCDSLGLGLENIAVANSSCNCVELDGTEGGISCTYKADFYCLETVWYD